MSRLSRAGVTTVLGILLSGAGCTGRSTTEQLMQIWRDPQSPLEQRTEAVRKLLPLGTRAVDVEKVLGKPDRRFHCYGDIVGLVTVGSITKDGARIIDGAAPRGERDEVLFIYESRSGGYVSLRFDVSASKSNWQGWPLVGIGFSTNAIIADPPDGSPSQKGVAH